LACGLGTALGCVVVGAPGKGSRVGLFDGVQVGLAVPGLFETFSEDPGEKVPGQVARDDRFGTILKEAKTKHGSGSGHGQ
jgi:hypothetical protein